MKKSAVGLVILLSILIGFVCGRLTQAPEQELDDRGEAAQQSSGRKSSGHLSKQSASPEHVRRLEIRNAAPAALPSLLFKALEEGDPILRGQLLADLLARMDAGNFQEMLAQLESVSNETGREYRDEWTLLNIRAGQVAGPQMMEIWKEKGLNSWTAQRTFFGWCNSDPVAAESWMREQPDLARLGIDGRFLNELAAGYVIHDSDRAKRWMASLPEEEKLQCVKGMACGLVDHLGKEAAVDWLVSVQSDSAGTEYLRRATSDVFDRLLWSGANRLNAKSMVSDLERLSNVMPVDEGWIVRSMGQIRDRKTTGGIDLLDQIARSPVLGSYPLTENAWDSGVGFALQRDRNAVEEWLEKNPDSPIHSKVEEMYSR